MKKRILAAALAAALILTGTAWAAGDSLVSLSYLTGPFREGIVSAVTETVTRAMQPLYEAAVSRLEGLLAALPERPVWHAAAGFTAQEGERDDTVTLAVGTGLYWTSGKAQVASGLLIDATEGTEVAAGGTLTVGHRYLADEETVVTLTSRTAHWLVEGVWSTTSDGISVLELPFTDVSEDDWFFEPVLYVVERELFRGVSDTQFAPEDYMERSMMATLFYRMEDSPEVEYTELFRDVPEDEWYAKYVVWAGQEELVNGVGDGLFAPEQFASRQEIAVLLYRYAVYSGQSVSAAASLEQFSDAGMVDDWAQEAMSWAVAVGLLRGDDTLTIRPLDPATRAEVAAIFQRYQVWTETPAPDEPPEPVESADPIPAESSDPAETSPAPDVSAEPAPDDSPEPAPDASAAPDPADESESGN